MGEPEPAKVATAADGSVLGTSTAASGPAGCHFEGQVAAFYLLAMLSGAPPRGLPGTTIERVALQQANAGRPLDDVVVHARDNSGNQAILEIQVKRTITFAPADPVFRKVVGQIVKASRRPDFQAIRYELGIATAKTSRKIDSAYQDVLMLARQIGDAEAFAAQISLAGAANDDMRAFVRTFKSHLRDEGSADDDATTWQLLRKLQILTFDFTSAGSASEELARERAARVLHSDDVSRASALWSNLVELAIDVAKSGGDRTRETLLLSLSPLGYRFLGDRRHVMPRAALAEASWLALDDIANRVGAVILTRQERIDAIHTALDTGRYLEIRGEVGVGKSGVLRLLAETLGIQSNVIVLSPGRCIPRGWLAMRAQLGFDGTLRDLLVELGNDGGAVLFVDNLDFFSDEEGLTVIDLVREASRVPGISVIATARLGFGIEEPSWLPADALDRLVRAEPVFIDGLSAAEIAQLKAGDPALVPLLSDSHPARVVSRNLFRLARLASQPASAPLPRTEIDMAEQWWSTADGLHDRGLRDRARLLQDAAEQTLSRADTINIAGRAAAPIDALVLSGTLRNLGIDRVAFRHDVLREWGIANVLHANASLIDRLNLEKPAPAMLARGIELAARMAIERGVDGKAWYALVQRLSRAGAHQSWRRAALLALVRSEAGATLLQRAASELLGNHSALLRELVRTVLAVEVIPSTKAFADGIDPAVMMAPIPPSLNIPCGPAWLPLVTWLLYLGEEVPGEAIPEAVELYTAFWFGTLGATHMTSLMTRQVYGWLRKMEPYDAMSASREEPVFWDNLEREQIQSLKFCLRSGFVLFARATPDLAAEYLAAVARSEHNDETVRSILKMRGTLAQAAPTELAWLTEQALIEKPRPRNRYHGREREDAFTFLDHEFLPASPAHMPFFELLVNSPTDGLALVRHLVDHAVAHNSRDRAPGSEAVTVAFPRTARSFPWSETYIWSRTSDYYCVTSALMALEAWAHRRIEAGDAFETVLVDVLGPVGSPAAYLLVAVDLVISHWPNSAGVATAFLACPELLCLDHTRQVYDRLETSDFSGRSALLTEPRGVVSVAELKRLASRRMSLNGLIGNYALAGTPEQRAKLVALLSQASVRLGPPSAKANLCDPEFMVLHALNLVDLGNWHEVAVTQRDGSIMTARQYASPAAERQHLGLQEAATKPRSDFAMQSSISLATENPTHLSSEARSAAMAWARHAANAFNPELDDSDDGGSQRTRDVSVVTAAMIAMRDGDDTLHAEHGEWARGQLEEALKAQGEDPAVQFRAGLLFNPTAIAYVGLIHALRHRNTLYDVRALLEGAARDNYAVAHGFGAAVSTLEMLDVRLPRALVRCGFSACIVPNRAWDTPEEGVAARAEHRLRQAKAAVDAEMGWLNSAGPEPQWPAFPRVQIRRKRRIRSREGYDVEVPEAEAQPPTKHVNHQAAALWLRQTRCLPDATARPWLSGVIKAYMPWTITANGAEIHRGGEVDHTPSEWNDAFFTMAARCLGVWSSAEVAEVAGGSITALPDRNFFDVLVDFLRGVDTVYFAGGDIQTSVAVDIRSALADRMMSSRGWNRLGRSKELSIEMHIARAIAVLFFNDYGFPQSTRCYLYEKSVDRIGLFLPILAKLVQSGPCPFVAVVLANLLEVAPRAEHLDLAVLAGKAWLDAYPDFRPFWIDYGFGPRWCQIVENIRAQSPASVGPGVPVRPDIDNIVAALVTLGVPEAFRLEEALNSHP